MMRKNLLLFFICLLPIMVCAQVTINVQIPQAGLIQKDQLWNIILINNQNELNGIIIKMDLTDAVTGQGLMTSTCNNVVLPNGVKIISAKDVQPVLYNVSDPDFSGNFLPFGSYIICYEVFYVAGKGEESLGRECVNLQVDPLSPPLLNFPGDQSVIPSPNPQFSWLPPSPLDLFHALTYQLLITEVLPGQNAYEAIETNLPVYLKDRLESNFESYPVSATTLDTGKIYAWQVIAKNKSGYLVKSETWTFSLNKNEIPDVGLKPSSYILLDGKATGPYIIQSGTLFIKYYSFAKKQNGIFSFIDDKGNVLETTNKEIRSGENYFDLKIPRSIQSGTNCKLTLVTADKKAIQLNFSIKKSY